MKSKMYKFVLLLLIMLTLTSCKSNSGDKVVDDQKIKSNKQAKKEFDLSKKKWDKQGLTSYYMKMEYSAFSPTAGTWEITVKNGKVIKFIQNGNPVENIEGETAMLTMDYLFEKAKASYKNKKDGLFLITSAYDEKMGYVKTLVKTGNINIKDRPTDTGFKYNIIELKKL